MSVTVGAALCAVAAVATFDKGPLTNTSATHFDTIVILGCPANDEGKPTPDQRERVMEGVREFRRGVAPRIIMTGGAAHNRFIEAHVMGELARSQGVPAAAIFEESRAQNTVQNAFYSEQIMEQHHWRTVEVVSSAPHIHRAALIFEQFPGEWRVHAAPWPPESSSLRIAVMYAAEIAKVAIIHTCGFYRSPFLPHHAAP